MTTSKDRRRIGQDPSRDETEGIPLDGFQDPTGEYPKAEYFYGSSINRAARGLKINNLYLGGGDFGISLNIEPQEPSRFPFNQVHETSSGHVVEYDDTPGGERILIKHRKGAGVEMRADGSVIISAVNNKVEVTGGDNTIIVEGEANLVYKGNLNLQVSGDFNIDVGGNYNVNVAGNKKEEISLNHRTTVSGNSEYITKKSRSTKTVENNLDVVLGENKQITKGNLNKEVEGNINMFSDADIMVSGKNEFVAVAKTANMSATQISILGITGSIGGSAVDFTGKVYQGPLGPVPFTSGAAFYGSFLGQSLESILSSMSHQSFKSATAGSLGSPGIGPPAPLPVKVVATQPSAPPPNPAIVGIHLAGGSYAIRRVTVDAGDALKDRILLKDDYEGLFEKIPTMQEIRSTIRDLANRDKIANKLIRERRLNPEYKKVSPPKIGRTSGKAPSSRFGYVPIGNAIANRGKRFTP